MPEGDTVHTLANALRPRLVGRRVSIVKLSGGPRIASARVRSVRALGKHLLFTLHDGRSIRSHLGMHGSWHGYPHGAPWQKPAARASLVIETDDEVLVCFNARSVELLRRGSVRERDFRAGIGPDLTSGDVDTAEISHRARRYAESDTPLVDVLLNQRIAAGVGNVYKSEVLHLLGLNPMRRWGSLSVSECDELFTTASRLLRRNLKGGPRVTRSGVNPSERLWVYRRKGDPCFHCGEAIVTERLGKDLRSTYWCPSCQPAEHESPGADESAGDGASGGGSERR